MYKCMSVLLLTLLLVACDDKGSKEYTDVKKARHAAAAELQIASVQLDKALEALRVLGPQDPSFQRAFEAQMLVSVQLIPYLQADDLTTLPPPAAAQPCDDSGGENHCQCDNCPEGSQRFAAFVQSCDSHGGGGSSCNDGKSFCCDW